MMSQAADIAAAFGLSGLTLQSSKVSIYSAAIGPDFNGEIGRRKTRRFHTGTTRRITTGGPLVPYGVHFGKVVHRVEPNCSAQSFGLVRARFGEQRVDLIQNGLGLVLDTCAGCFLRHLTGEINRIAVNHDLAHTVIGV